MKTLSIIVPAYNEEDGIENIIKRLLNERLKISQICPEISQVEIIVVNDNSKDKTAEIVQKYREIILINHIENKGYGGALKSGFASAKGDLLAFLDADGTYPPEFLSCLCSKLIEYDADIVLGSRFLGAKSRMPILRRIGNRLYAVLLSWLTDKKISDTATGMRVFKRAILPTMYPLPDGLSFTPAMSTRVLNEDLKIHEIPMPYDKREGLSKLNIIKDGYRFLMSIITIARLYNPLKFFGPIGIFFMMIAIIFSIEPIGYYIFSHTILDKYIYRLITIVVFFTAGLNIISSGILANNIVSILHKKKQSKIILHGLIYEKIYNNLNYVGLLSCLTGILINYKTIYQYLTTGGIYIHWSYVLTGAILILSGVQLYLFDVLIKIINELKKRYTSYKDG